MTQWIRVDYKIGFEMVSVDDATNPFQDSVHTDGKKSVVKSRIFHINTTKILEVTLS